MGSDTDRLPTLDEDELADTVVLTESDVMATREMRQLLDPGAEADEADDEDGNDEG